MVRLAVLLETVPQGVNAVGAIILAVLLIATVVNSGVGIVDPLITCVVAEMTDVVPG